MSNFCKLLAGALALGLLSGCQQVHTTSGGAVGVQREQRMSLLISAEQLDQEAGLAYKEMLRGAEHKQQLNTKPAMVKRLRAIAARIAPHTGVFRSDAPAWNWQTNQIDSDELNAFCLPGGKIAFYSGIVERLKLSDDEIAAIMGHEMAHALREHGREKASQDQAQQLLKVGLSLATDGKAEQYFEIGDLLANLGYNLPYSRNLEKEADAMGLELAARAGYDPRAAITLWQKMGAASAGQPPQFLSTHPAHGNRIQELQAKLPLVMPLYESAK